VVPVGSFQFNKFIDFMRSFNFGSLYKFTKEQAAIQGQGLTPYNNIAEYMWICVNCWEVLLGHDAKREHVNARHLLTASLAEMEPQNTDSYVKFCRNYGKVNPEETHVVLYYVPSYVRDAVVTSNYHLEHVV